MTAPAQDYSRIGCKVDEVDVVAQDSNLTVISRQRATEANQQFELLGVLSIVWLLVLGLPKA